MLRHSSYLVSLTSIKLDKICHRFKAAHFKEAPSLKGSKISGKVPKSLICVICFRNLCNQESEKVFHSSRSKNLTNFQVLLSYGWVGEKRKLFLRRVILFRFLNPFRSFRQGGGVPSS
jgi:hypothetical protein